MNFTWQFQLTGWPWWLVLPCTIAGVWALVRLHRREMMTLPSPLRRRLLALRGAALALLVLFLTEPVFTRMTEEKVLPLVAVLVDQSGSMAVKDAAIKPGTKHDPSSDLSRHQLALKLAREKVAPALRGRARPEVFSLDTGLSPLNLAQSATLVPNRATDFESCLAELARLWAREYVGGVVLLTDGRQTMGGDAAPVVRSLRARGALVSGIFVADTATPPDAVVADISGSTEVFLGENIQFSARYRITGAPELDWDLIITQDGREIQRQPVRGAGQWQYATFTFPATNTGMNLYQARLELAKEQSSDWLLQPTGSLQLDVWNNITGSQVSELTNNPGFRKPPSSTAILERLAFSNRGAEYGARLRAYLIPPQSGSYTFWISSDDASELWLSPNEDPAGKTRVAYISGFVAQGVWSGQPSQKSQPIALHARQPYYLEILFKQGGGEDHWAVGWRLPDNTMERPIPASRLARFEPGMTTQLATRKQQLSRAKTNDWQEASLANNSAEFSVAVNQDPIKVLLLDSTPRWESRYLAAMFERDRRVSLTRRYHAILVDEKKTSFLPRNQDEWDAYDMVCLGDLDSNELPAEQQKLLAEFVGRRGGFLVCLAGPRGLPKAFSLGTLANLLPVRVALASNRDPEPAAVTLTPDGADHPIMQILNDPGLNQKLWPLLPPLQWMTDAVVAKPGATVLLTALNSAKTPVVAIARYGAGRVFWMGTEESWRWRDRLGDRVHQTFWLQAMRWGLAGRLRGKDPRLQIGLDRYLMAPEETAEIKVRVTTKEGRLLQDPPLVTIEKIGDAGDSLPGAGTSVEMQGATEAPGIWRKSLKDLTEGTWRISVSHRDPSLAGVVETRDLVARNPNGREGLDLSGDLAALTRLTGLGGHRTGTQDQAEAIVQDLATRLQPRRQEHRQTLRLWNNYVSLLIVMALFCVEWIWRKKRGLP
jgi:uncharacterized membrane protein